MKTLALQEARRRWDAASRGLLVLIESQRIECFEQGRIIQSYPVSTAAQGSGNRQNSLQTPVGLHHIAAKIGENAAIGTVFRARKSIHQHYSELPQRLSDDLITSRILWLSGDQEGFNQGADVDSYQRYIYIHGTAQEELIGQPVSHGCVRMLNTDVIELFDWARVGDPVLLEPGEGYSD